MGTYEKVCAIREDVENCTPYTMGWMGVPFEALPAWVLSRDKYLERYYDGLYRHCNGKEVPIDKYQI